MSSEENYLNDLLNSLSETVQAKSGEAMPADAAIENEDAGISETDGNPLVFENEISAGDMIPGETQSLDKDSEVERIVAEEPAAEEPILLDDINLDSIEIPEIPEIPDMELPDMDIKLEGDLDSLEIPELLGSEPDIEQEKEPEADKELKLEDFGLPGISDMDEGLQPEKIELPEMGEELQLDNIELSGLDEGLQQDDVNLPDFPETGDEFTLEDIMMPEEEPEQLEEAELEDINLEDIELPDLGTELPEQFETGEPLLNELELPEISEEEPEPQPVGTEQSESAGALQPEDIEQPDLPQLELGESLQLEDTGLSETVEEPQPVDIGQPEVTEEIQEIPETGENLALEDIGMPELDEELKLEDFEMPEIPDDSSLMQNDMNIDGLEEAIQSETETAMAGELNIDEFDFGDASDLGSSMESQNDLSLSDDSGEDISAGMDDSLEDVLNMLDDDAELAEINDMLKKSDNNEPIQDDMMDILNQMADDEAASVNAGVKHVDDEDDGGVPLPVIPESILNPDGAGMSHETSDDSDAKKKGKKNAKKKKKGDAEEHEAESTKEPGKLGKFFNLLTEELVPEPTEEELAAEKEAKQAKKKEELTKKEEEKLAKEEEKKAKAEEKAAAEKAKQEAAAQKKKEKKAAKEAKLAAKRAAEVPKKRIPPKKIAAAAAFGASVGGAVILAANILSTQGYLQKARNAYYDKDYKTVYQAMFGMELDESKDEGLIKARSEVIYKIQRRYDSYQINLKMGREMEALDALLQGIATYDYINADAEKYGVADEVDAVKETILNTLADKYSIDEAKARELINTEDALTYSIALSDIIAAN